MKKKFIIIEGNKLIAQFMSFQKKGMFTYFQKNYITCIFLLIHMNLNQDYIILIVMKHPLNSIPLGIG